MLGGEHHCFQSEGLSVFIILHGNLTLSVRTKIRQRAVLAHLGKLSGQLVGKGNRIRHIFFRLIGRVTEHHTLIPCANRLQLLIRHRRFSRFQRLVHAHCNIGRLLVDGNHDGAGIAVKSILRFVIADFLYGVPYNLGNIHICGGCNLTGHQYKTGAACSLARHAAHGVLHHKRIQNGIGDGVAHLVGMSFRYGFRRKQ